MLVAGHASPPIQDMGSFGYGTDLMSVSHFGSIEIQLFVVLLAQYDACRERDVI